MTSDRLLGRLVRSVGAAAVLVAVVAGIPVALAVLVGWPLPRAVPSLDDITASLDGQSIDDALIVKALAVLCWLAWAQFAACVAAEIAACRHGREARHVPAASILQPVVARLLITVALMVHIVPRPSPARAATIPMAAAVHVDHRVSAPEPAAVVVATATPTPEAVGPHYVVKDRDDLWSLAETHLGDGTRWREVFELNRGRPQPKGETLRYPRLIRPGWTLEFPADASGLTTAPPAERSTATDPAETASASSPDRAVIGADTEPVPTTQPTPTACPPPPVVEAPADLPRQAPPSTQPPPRNVEAPVLPAPSSPAAPMPVPAPSASEPADRDSEVHDDDPQSNAPVGLVGATLLAAGVVATLDRLRRVQQRRRGTGRVVRMPGPEAAPTEVTLRRASAASSAGRLDLALRAFAHAAAQRRSGNPPQVSAVQVGSNRIEILLSEPLESEPGPFQVEGGGLAWILEAGGGDDDLQDAARLRGAPLPALASIGTLGDSTVLIDLEGAGCTTLEGDADETATAFRSLVLELATNLWADDLYVVVVDPEGNETLDALERVRVVASLDEALPGIEADAAAVSDALTAASAATTLGARLDTPADGWIPTVVLCRDPLAEPEALAHLVGLAATGGRGLSLVVRGPVEGAGRALRYDQGKVEIAPPGVTVSISGPRADQADHLDDILAAAVDCTGVAGPDPADETELFDDDHAVVDDPFATHDIDVLVRLLGSIEIEGAKDAIDRRKAIEMVVYLATHPRGVSDEQLKAALWPDEGAPQASFNTTVTRARSRLGTGRDGRPHLPHIIGTKGLYRVGPHVTTDFALLERHLTIARSQPADAAIRVLRQGLELVRGLPFAGGRAGYEWAFAEGLVARMETVVAEAGHHLAELALEAKDPDLAQWAACQGLKASPGDEVLYRDRMLACDLAGNPAGVEAVMDELIAAAEAVEPYDNLHAETLALYQRLSHRRRRTG